MRKIILTVFLLLPVVAFAMGNTRTPVYGRPTLYGEYEISAADTRHAAAMYGAVPQNPAAKMPVKVKKVASKNSIKKKKKTAVKAEAKKKAPMRAVKKVAAPVMVKKAEEQKVEIAVKEPAPVVEPVPAHAPAAPSPVAVSIAASAAGAPHDIDAFCTQRGGRGAGRLPDGFVLMPGRPDLMSCRDK